MDKIPRPTLQPPAHTYTYLPFPDTRSIRILTLQPSAQSFAPLIGSLSIENLDSLINCEADSSYETISYVWGTGGRCEFIVCDGEYLPLTKSIHDALCRVRLDAKPRRLWADQICINQDDVRERNSQVRLMNEVYKAAARILVWLGPDEKGDALRAKDTVDYLHGVFGDEDAHREFRIAHSEQLYRQDHVPWIPFARLTKLPWFGRIWIVQEIGTGAPASLFWGSAELDWKKLSNVCGILNQQYHFLRTRFHISTPSIRYLYNRFVEPQDEYDENHNRGNFVYELHRARHLLARDPRDHIYAFLGHFSIQKGSLELRDLTADYSRPVSQVYCDVAVRALRDASSLILLSAVHNVASDQRKPPSYDASIDLPSWVPDWRVLPVHMLGTPDTPHAAAGKTAPKLTIDHARHVLHIRGVSVDSIRQRSCVFYGKAFQFRQARWSTSPLEALWTDVCGHDVFDLDLKYAPRPPCSSPGGEEDKESQSPPHESSAFFALVQTLSNGCVGADRSRAYEDIPSRTWLCNGASYLVKSGVPAHRISPQLLAAAQAGDPFKWSHEATLVSRYRRFAVTHGGYFVMGPDSMEDGDAVVVLDGGKTPFVLRREQVPGRWALVGECYVHGLMAGEAHRLRDPEPEVFSIW